MEIVQENTRYIVTEKFLVDLEQAAKSQERLRLEAARRLCRIVTIPNDNFNVKQELLEAGDLQMEARASALSTIAEVDRINKVMDQCREMVRHELDRVIEVQSRGKLCEKNAKKALDKADKAAQFALIKYLAEKAEANAISLTI
jgi:hypothetical protein